MKHTFILLLTGLLMFSSCSNKAKEEVTIEEEETVAYSNTEDAQIIFSEKKDKEREVPDIATRTLAQADMEAMMARQKIDDRFEKLFIAKTKLEEAKVYASQFERGTSDYTIAQRQVESAEKSLQAIIDDVNSRYASIYGFLLTVSNCDGLAEAVRDKVKATICREIYEKYKQIALDELEYEYTGIMPEDY